jgi:hypothetical protein
MSPDDRDKERLKLAMELAATPEAYYAISDLLSGRYTAEYLDALAEGTIQDDGVGSSMMGDWNGLEAVDWRLQQQQQQQQNDQEKEVGQQQRGAFDESPDTADYADEISNGLASASSVYSVNRVPTPSIPLTPSRVVNRGGHYLDDEILAYLQATKKASGKHAEGSTEEDNFMSFD